MAEDNARNLAPEEYKTLCDQMSQLQQDVRTLWASAFGFYIAALGTFCVVLTNLYKDKLESGASNLYPFLDWGGLNVMTTILLGIVAVMLFLGYMWQRQSYRLGSYIQVFYEEEDPRFKWITLNRGDKESILRSVRLSVPTVLANSGLLLAIVAFLPTFIGVLCVFVRSHCYSLSFVATLVVVIALFLVCLWWYRKLRSIHKEQQEMVEEWQRIKQTWKQKPTPG